VTGRPTYTYAVALAFDPGAVDGLYGVDGARVRLVRHDDIVAVCSSLPVGAIDEAAQRDRLDTPEGLERLARAHHDVVAEVAEHGVTLPLRLMTIHHGDEGVAAMLRREYGRLRAGLGRVAGRVEMGVKVYADVLPEPGRHEDVWRRAAFVSGRVEAELAHLAVDQRRHRPQAPQLSGRPGENVFNAAYLVDRAEAGAFAARARELGLGRTGVRVEVSGPWAPYSFAETR